MNRLNTMIIVLSLILIIWGIWIGIGQNMYECYNWNGINESVGCFKLYGV